MSNSSLKSYPMECLANHDYLLEVLASPFLRLALCGIIVSTSVFVVIWFQKFRLRYLLRGTCVGFAAYASCYPVSMGIAGLMGTIVLSFAILRYHWGMPLEIIKDHLSVGFDHLSEHQRTLHQRDPDYVTPVFPNGWIPIVESSRVDNGQAISVTAIGFRFCVFRGEGGQVRVLDAFCSHLGADLGAGGRIKGDCIECPFHGWQFSGKDGRCTHIPYSEKVLESARVRTWDSCERNKFVFVWHHAEGDPPTWQMPRIPEIEDGKWIMRGRISHDVHCHIQEIHENAADASHLYMVHSPSILKGSRWTEAPSRLLDLIHHEYHPYWRLDDKCQHVAKLSLEQCIRLGGFVLPCSQISFDIEQIGPAVAHMRLFTWFGRGVQMTYVIPEGPLRNRIVQVLYTEPKFKQAPANVLIFAEALMFERDVILWNHKKYLRKPVLVREDKLINLFRRWYGQFYSEHSLTLRQIRERSFEW